MVQGCRVPFPEELSEGYEILDGRIVANVNAEKLLDAFKFFIVLNRDERGFFFLELPVNRDEEVPKRPGVVETFHRRVYYIDDLPPEESFAILRRSGDLLINDGISSFGFGFQTRDEIMLDKYNIVTISSSEVEKYAEIFLPLEIPRVENLKTAWDTFTQDNPGIAERVEIDGKTVFDLPEEYRDWGIYEAEVRSD